jgi:hypothetical protein
MYGTAAVVFAIPAMSGEPDGSGDWMVYCCGAVVAGFAVFVTFGFIAVVRTRIALSATALEGTVPAGHNLLLVPAFRTLGVPIAEIRSVERRREIVRVLGLSNLRESLSVVTGDGTRIGLFANTSGPSSQLPLGEIADAIAAAAGIDVTDGGTVRTKAPGLYGTAASTWNEPKLDDAAAAAATKTALRTVQLSGVLVLLVIALRACT